MDRQMDAEMYADFNYDKIQWIQNNLTRPISQLKAVVDNIS